jgi:hypothetical protein
MRSIGPRFSGLKLARLQQMKREASGYAQAGLLAATYCVVASAHGAELTSPFPTPFIRDSLRGIR